MGPSLFFYLFSYRAFPGPYPTCPLHSCKGSWSHLSPWKFEGWPLEVFGQKEFQLWPPECHQPLSGSCSAGEILPFTGSFSNRRHAGIVRAQLPFLARSREAGVCPECLRAAGAGGRDEVMALAGLQGHSHSAYCCFQQSHICFQHLGKFMLPFNGKKRNPYAHFNLQLVLHFSWFGWDIIYANQSTCFGKKKEEKWLLREKR